MVWRWTPPGASVRRGRAGCGRGGGENGRATPGETRRSSAMTVTRPTVTARAVAGGAATLPPAMCQQPQKLTVRTDFPPWGMHAGLHLAVDNGAFKAAGVDVDVSDGKGSSLVMQQIAAGEIDVGWVQ